MISGINTDRVERDALFERGRFDPVAIDNVAKESKIRCRRGLNVKNYFIQGEEIPSGVVSNMWNGVPHREGCQEAYVVQI
jgi:hypothetical protein